MARADNLLAQRFICPRCDQRGTHVERLVMSGIGKHFNVL